MGTHNTRPQAGGIMRSRYGAILLVLGLSPAVQAEESAITAAGKVQGFSGFWEDYERCKARQEFTPVRGEYETQEEYRRRVERLRVGCDTFRRVEPAHIDVPVELRYDADQGRFLFELPTAEGVRLQYAALVQDDFPKQLEQLPRDRWHIDDPTPKASAYKECSLRKVHAAESYFERVEPFRTDSWRGCMTYYRQGDEDTWFRDASTFFISDVTFYAYADIESARRIKEMEKQLFYRVRGVLSVPERSFDVQQVDILNRKSGERLITLTP